MRTAKRFVEFYACGIKEKENDKSTTHSIDGFWRRFMIYRDVSTENLEPHFFQDQEIGQECTYYSTILKTIRISLLMNSQVHATRQWRRSGGPFDSGRSGRERSACLAGHAKSDPSKQRVGSILGIFGPSCVAFWQNLARSQYELYGHHFWAIDVLEPTQLPFQARIGSINTNVMLYCQGTVVCDSEGCHGSDFGYFCRIWRGVFAVHAK